MTDVCNSPGHGLSDKKRHRMRHKKHGTRMPSDDTRVAAACKREPRRMDTNSVYGMGQCEAQRAKESGQKQFPL